MSETEPWTEQEKKSVINKHGGRAALADRDRVWVKHGRSVAEGGAGAVGEQVSLHTDSAEVLSLSELYKVLMETWVYFGSPFYVRHKRH